MNLLEEQKPVAGMNDDEIRALCAALRAMILETVSETGGHLAPNLGAVELTVALHRCFDVYRDRIVFDVGHQCYAHKILTGRAEKMKTLRTFGGIAGFPKPAESAADAFATGHASTSVSAALGMARARTLEGKDYKVVAVIGDGALTGGLAYEGLCDAGESGEPLIVVLNDNGMSITKNVGAVARYLAEQRLKPQYIRFKRGYYKFTASVPGGRGLRNFNHRIKSALKNAILPSSMFESMGFSYLGPVDGHDVKRLGLMLEWAKELNCPVLLHVRTVKGKGVSYAEATPEHYHGVAPFDPATGEPKKPPCENFSAVFGETLTELAAGDARVCAVTAAMEEGTGLASFAARFPARFFDVGIAEGHAVTMSAGMAKQGLLPVFAVYSSFLQRGYDMLIHDVAIQNLHVVFGVDRAGLVGEDGETHHGMFDVPFLSTVPNMTVLCPASFAELRSMLARAVTKYGGPVAVRYPRGGEGEYRLDAGDAPSALLRKGSAVTLVSYGTLVNELLAAAETLAAEGIEAEVVKLNSILPLDADAVAESVKKTRRLLVLEDCAAHGGVGERLAAHLAVSGVPAEKILLRNLGERFVPHGTVPQLRRLRGLDAAAVADAVREMCHGG
ncbi:MAG TPA: 1-deoxy-D-xylulose-5-phosphate synthase [Oscillospiraceae bacterium]|nr:1-deoxy-D-xylulose-5-phosphate synthase [Oscillospiraceae bacterium]